MKPPLAISIYMCAIAFTKCTVMANPLRVNRRFSYGGVFSFDFDPDGAEFNPGMKITLALADASIDNKRGVSRRGTPLIFTYRELNRIGEVACGGDWQLSMETMRMLTIPS